jgi:hypothetical protein
MSEDAQVKRMVKEMRKRKVKSWEFMRYMYITSPHRRMTDIRERGIEIEQERVTDENGKLTMVKQYWIKRRPRGQKRPEQAMEYEDMPKSNWFMHKSQELNK